MDLPCLQEPLWNPSKLAHHNRTIFNIDLAMKSKRDEQFFIGWEGNWQANFALKGRLLTIALFALVVVVSLIFVSSQPTYKDSLFDFPNITSVEGTYLSEPFPHLISDNEVIVLVGFGKFSALKDIYKYTEETGQSIEGKRVRISGTKISFDQRQIYELTMGWASIELLGDGDNIPSLSSRPTSIKTYSGEVIDPKCYFGAMNPAEGKIHRSCAIRCLSGGIPAAFVIGGSVEKSYYIIRGDRGQDINSQLLCYVGERVNISGKVTGYFNWNIINMDEGGISYH